LSKKEPKEGEWENDEIQEFEEFNSEDEDQFEMMMGKEVKPMDLLDI
jgi:hypothetical protein